MRFRVWVMCVASLYGPSSIAVADEATEQAFQQLVDESWEYDLRADPLFATDSGDHRYNDRLPQVRPADYQQHQEYKQALLKRVERIDRDQLSPEQQINYDIFRRLLNDAIEELRYKSHLIPITGRSGFHIQFPELRRQVPLKNERDYENYIARLAAFNEYARQHIALMRTGIGQEYVLPDVVLQNYDQAIKVHIVDDPEDSLLFEPLRALPESLPADRREELVSAAKNAIRDGVVPGYQAFLDFMRSEYVPAARATIGASELPNGREFYRHRVRRFTTLDVTPEEIHQLGLSEVERIRAEMDEVIRRSGFDGDFAAFVEHLRTDEKFYAKSADELMAATAMVCKKMDGKLPELFGKLPRMSYGLRAIPAYIAPRTTTAYYEPPAGDGSKAGYYFVNTYNLPSRPLYGVEALSLHEAVPGHHLQIALQQELENLPKFRRFAGFTAFVEGWGLYAERLGLEVGFYEDPYSDFGRLTYEMWRACRLVVDTGMHYLGWTRQQAIDFMAENSALSLHNIRAEVDRYIAWPGQALAYKMGELKIRELRTHAETRLGKDFDVREFHDVVLGSGAVPLDVLEEQVQAWIENSR